jgi:hypothetical protein
MYYPVPTVGCGGAGGGGSSFLLCRGFDRCVCTTVPGTVRLKLSPREETSAL